MFHKIYVEKELTDHPQWEIIKKRFPKSEIEEVTSYSDYFGKFRKPYLQKRTKLNLFVANKKGQLVKEAPEAYGWGNEKHYYYIHAYNCIYECEYCYLQGYFDSPDIVLFLNHEEIYKEMESLVKQNKDSIWFHAGEFSDSLALSHLTGEISYYYPFFKEHKNAKLELRTKSANIKELLKQEALNNVFTSFSLGGSEQVTQLEHKTAPLGARLKAMKTLTEAGHQVAVHFDPIVYNENYISQYAELVNNLIEMDLLNQIQYFSLGVVRFTKEVYRQVIEHYPESKIIGNELVTSFDGKTRYPKPLRMSILRSIEKLLLDKGVSKDRIYLCME